MAKKDKKAKQDDTEQRTDPVEAVRAAVERALASAGGTAGARERTRDLIDDFATFAGRFRASLEELRVIDEVRSLRAEIEALSRRVAELESRAAKEATQAKPASTRRSTAKPKTSTRAATSSRSGSSASRRPAGAKTSSTMTPKE